MIPKPPTMTVPLQTDEHGSIRVGGTRITLDVVIARFQQGSSPETIHESFDVLAVNDIYAVIAYYLANRAELDTYLERRNQETLRLRQEWEAKYPPTVTRADLERRLAAHKKEQDN